MLTYICRIPAGVELLDQLVSLGVPGEGMNDPYEVVKECQTRECALKLILSDGDSDKAAGDREQQHLLARSMNGSKERVGLVEWPGR